MSSMSSSLLLLQLSNNALMMQSMHASESHDYGGSRRTRGPENSNGLLFFLLPILFLLLVCGMCMLSFLVRGIYLWLKRNRKSPVTRDPVIPFSQDHLHLFIGSNDFPNRIPHVKIQVSSETPRKRFFDGLILGSSRRGIDRVNEWARMILEPNRCYGFPVPNIVPINAQTVSIPMEGFKCGEKCHDFEPIDGAVEGSYYTYQMFGDNRIQVTRYVENEVSYVAGFCFYIEKLWISRKEYNETVVKKLLKEKKYPRRSEPVKPSYHPPPPYNSIFVV